MKTHYYSSNLVIATKGGLVRTGSGRETTINNRPEYLRDACEKSLSRLDIEAIPLYFIHAIDDAVPIEDTLGCLNDLVIEGKVHQLGICNINLQQLKKAKQVADIRAIQNRYNIFNPKNRDLVDYCEKSNVIYMVQQPFNRGLTFNAKYEFNNKIEQYSDRKASLMLHRILQESNVLVPIPSARTIDHVKQISIKASQLGNYSKKHKEIAEIDCLNNFKIDFPNVRDQIEESGVIIARNLLCDNLKDEFNNTVLKVFNEVESKLKSKISSDEISHLDSQQSRGSLLIVHYPEVIKVLDKLLKQTFALDFVRALLECEDVSASIGFSRIRKVDPKSKAQRSYSPPHQDGKFLGRGSVNFCIPVTGYGEEYIGMDFFLDERITMNDKQLNKVIQNNNCTTPIIKNGDAIIFDDTVIHRRSRMPASLTRVNLEIRLFRTGFTPSLGYPVIEF